MPKLPMRSMTLSPSGGGKTVLLQSMILDIYRGCLNRVYLFSPSIDIDHTWRSVKDYIAKEIKPNDREKLYFDSYSPVEIETIINKQQNGTSYLKSQGHTNMFQILKILDDFADSREFSQLSIDVSVQ